MIWELQPNHKTEIDCKTIKMLEFNVNWEMYKAKKILYKNVLTKRSMSYTNYKFKKLTGNRPSKLSECINSGKNYNNQNINLTEDYDEHLDTECGLWIKIN